MKHSTLKTAVLFFIILGCVRTTVLLAYAENPSPVTAVTNTVPGNDPAIDINSQDIEKNFELGEAALRKVKVKHVRQERTQHIQNTEDTYEEAQALYRQKRIAKSKEAFARVEDSMADYKSTDTYLRIIDNRSLQQAKLRMQRINEMQGTQLVIDFADQAAKIYQQAAALGNDNRILPVRKKLIKVKEVLERIKQKKIEASQQLTEQMILDKMVKEADNFDQEVSKLASIKDYQAAKMKYDQFKQTMVDELTQLKQKTVHENNQLSAANAQARLLDDKGYRTQEKALLRQGIDLYRKKQYIEAQSIFSELAAQGDTRAQSYLKAIERQF